MAKGPSGGQKAFVAQILAGSRQIQRAQSTIAQRHDANYQSAQPRNLQLERQAAANWGRQSAGAASAAANAQLGGGSLLGDIGGGLGGVLSAIDTGRAAVVSGVRQLGHGVHDIAYDLSGGPSQKEIAAKAIANLTPATRAFMAANGGKTAPDGRVIPTLASITAEANPHLGVSLDQYLSDVGRHVGYGQVLSEGLGRVDPRTGEGTGQITGNSVADFGIGFAGDVAMDPLSYVLPSHLGTEEATGHALEATNAARAAGDVQGVMRGEEIVAKLGRTKSVAGLTADDLSFIGKDGEGGFRVAGKRIGEQGGQDLRNAIYEHNPLSAARRSVGDLLDKSDVFGRRAVNGSTAEIKAALRSGVPQDAWSATNTLRGVRVENMLLGSVSNELRQEGIAAIKDSGLKPDQLLDAFHGLQGDAEAAARIGGDKLKPLRDWYEKAAQQYEAATGKPLNRLDYYVNRGITDEMRARVGTNQKGSLGSVVADFAKERKIGPGSELFGGVVPEGLSPSGVIKWANTQAETVFGHGMYKTDLAGLMDSYAHQVGTAVGVARRNTMLANAGLITPRATTEIAPDAARVAAQGEKVAAQEGRVATAADAVTGAKDQTARAEQALAAHESGSASINALTGKVDLSQLDQAHSAIDYHQQHMDAMVPATAENAPQVGQRVAADAEASQARVVGLAQKGGLTPAKANDYVDASVSFADAKSWGERAASEPDPLKAHLAAMRAQEASLEGAMHEEGIKLSTARDKLSAASVPKQKLAELTQGALRVSFNGIDHEMDPTVARLIQSTMDLTKPKEVGAFLQNYDKILHWVKTWEITSPRFLAHITLGHAWNNALARIEMGSYRDFFAADRAFSKSPEAFDAFRSQSPDVAKAYEDVRQMVDGGAHDYSKIEMGQSGKGTILPTQNNYLVNATRKGGGNIQRMMRTSLGMDTILRKGGTVDDAIEKIAMYHFDYADLSGFERDVVKRVIPFYCVPEDHEILTRRGWLHHHELIEGEAVMAFDSQTHEMHWEPLLEVATFDYDDDLWTLDRRGGSFEFTPNHRWPYEVARTTVKGHQYGGERGIAEARELNTTHVLPATGEFVDEGDSLLSPRLAAILGWIVTDGHGRWRGNHYEAVVYQAPHKFLPQIEKLLGAERRKPHPETGVCAVPVSLADRKAIIKHYHDKDDLPSLVTHLSREAAEAMWQAMFDAEGCTNQRGEMSFSQQDGPVKEAFQTLCYMTGRSAWTQPGKQDVYIRTATTLGVKEGFGRKCYQGVVWCPRTPTGTWLVRHDGAVMPTGNTWTRRNLPLQLEMLAKRPSVYSKYNAFTRNVEAVSPADKGAGLLPSYFGEQGAFRTPFQEGGSSVYGSAGATPLKEVQDNPLDWRTWASQVAPQLKAPVELYAGKQFYKNLPISDKQMALPAAVKPLAPILTGLGVAQTDKSGNVTVSGKVAYALEQFAPQIAVAQRAPGGAKSKDKAVTNMVNYVLGLGLLVNTPAAQKSEQYRRQNAVQAAKDKAAGKTASFTFKYKPKAK